MLKFTGWLMLTVAFVPAANCGPSLRQYRIQASDDGQKGVVPGSISLVLGENASTHMTNEDKIKIGEELKKSSEDITPASNHRTGVNRHSHARNLDPSMEMIDPKRHPKPKKPMGNDIGVARELDSAREYNPGGYGQGISSRPDHLEATVSIGITMGRANVSETDESAIVSREIHDIMDSMPKVSDLHIANFELPIDPEEEAINRRITEVARQLAENETRKEYEGKLGFVIPLPTRPSTEIKNNRNVLNLMKTGLHKTVSTSQMNGKPFEPKKEFKPQSNPVLKDMAEKPTNPSPVVAKDTSRKSGKSFIRSSALPLVSHLPQETAQLQLIGEIPQIPHFLFREGFPLMTPAPELTGPLLGGPLLKDEPDEERIGRAQGRSLYFRESQKNIRIAPAYLPDHIFQPNDVTVTVLAGGRHMTKWHKNFTSEAKGKDD